MRHPPDSVRFNEPCRHGTSGGIYGYNPELGSNILMAPGWKYKEKDKDFLRLNDSGMSKGQIDIYIPPAAGKDFMH